MEWCVSAVRPRLPAWRLARVECSLEHRRRVARRKAEAEVDGGIMTTHRYLSLEIIYFLVRTAFNYEGKLTD